MNTFLRILFLLPAFSGNLLAQEWNLALARPGAPVAITVPAKHTITFGTTQARNQSSQSATLDFGNGASYSTTTGAFPDQTHQFTGPLTLTISVNGGISAFHAVNYKITNSTAVYASPSNAVVIPTNATGNVQIILESSTDLINWSAANPGTYSPTTANRFFRVRAVQP